MVLLRPREILLNSPIILGATCLDRSKVIYFSSFYCKLKKIFGDNIEFCNGDTDSYQVWLRDPDKNVLLKHVQNESWFDFSKINNQAFFDMYPEIPDLKTRNSGKLGLLKIETLSVRKAIFLKPKCYILLEGDQEEQKRAKGVFGPEMRDIHYDTYEAVAFHDKIIYVNARLIRSFNHNLFNINVKKLGFHSLSLSRAFVEKNKSYPFGHWRLQEYCMEM